MSNPLEQRLFALRRRMRWITAVYALCIVAAAVLATATAIGVVDCTLRLQDRGLRILAWLVLLAVASATVYRYIVTILLARVTNADLAASIERRYPSLKDGLLSAVHFMGQAKNDATAGSTALRRAVVEQITRDSEPLCFNDAISARPAMRAFSVLAATAFLATGLIALSPANAKTAIARLVNPFGNAAWPRKNHLEIHQAQTRLARGQSFQAEVIDVQGAPLPADMRIHYRLDPVGASAAEESQPLVVSQGVALAQRNNVQTSFSYRVDGGDDHTMPWTDVAVADPPAIAASSIAIVPPSYTGWPKTDARPPLRVLIGSDVRITAEATKPLASAVLVRESGIRIPARLDRDGRTLNAVFRVERSDSYRFELVDREGFVGGSDGRGEIHAAVDAAPTVAIERPTTDLMVTPQAIVPLRVTATDDVEVRGIVVKFAQGDSGLEETLPLPLRHERRQPQTALTVDSCSAEYRWDLRPLKLAVPTRIAFRAVASDVLGHHRQSEPRYLTIVTAEELQEHLAARHQAIEAALQRTLAMQRECRGQIDKVRKEVRRLAAVRSTNVDIVQSAQHGQAEIEEALASRQQGVPMHILALIDELDNNHVDGRMQRQLKALLDDLERIARRHLPPAGREILTALKTAQLAIEGQGGEARLDKEVVAALAAAAEHQQATIDALEHVIESVSQSNVYGRLARDMADLLDKQKSVARQTAAVGRRTLAQSLRDLTPSDASEVSSLAGQQAELARRFDRWLREMEQAPADAAQHNTVADAVRLARRLAIGEQMRSTGQHIDNNHIGQAATGQKRIAADLQAVLASFTEQQQSRSETTAPTVGPDGGDEATSRNVIPPPDNRQPPGTGNEPSNAPGTATDGSARPPVAQQRRTMIMRLWGQLPPHARQQIVQPPSEEFPPKYEREIEEYFRRLAEEKQSRD